MRVKKDLDLAWNILIHSKLRSWLTIIGIIVGIASVVSILSISQGAQKSITEQMSSFGADIVTITAGNSRIQGIAQSMGISMTFSQNNKDNPILTSKDINALRTVKNVSEIMGTVSGQAEVSYKSKTEKMSISGVDALVWEYFNEGVSVSEGRLLTGSDKYSVVIGSGVVDIFDDDVKVGSKIIIEGKSFTVVGILKSSGGMSVSDNSIIMPYSVAVNTLENKKDKEYDTIYVKLSNIEDADNTIESIEKKLMLSRGILFENEKDFNVFSRLSIQETLSTMMDTLSFFLGAIAAISLIVGAVGIANSMFTSVLEKTRDIGVMKAIGAKNKDILIIFLFNSGLIGLVGGVGGVLVGTLLSNLINVVINSTSSYNARGMGMSAGSTYVSFGLIIGALVLSVVIGMISGLIPAMRASKLKPVDALRSE